MQRRAFIASLAAASLRANGRVPIRKATKITKLFRSPDGHPNALEATPEGLWVGEQVTDIAGETSGEAINEVKRRIQRIREGLEDVVSDKSQGAVDAAQQIGENLTESLEQALRTRPMTALAVAVGIGFLFGTAWRR